MKPELQIEGGRKLRRAFREVGDDMSDLKELHKRLADDVADSAKRKVPVRSGRLQRSMRIRHQNRCSCPCRQQPQKRAVLGAI